ncbi:DUF2726 domain-containing protein [Pseudomonas stutzeri]|uniref:DUF2726 domain-containing protein n=1 Tax=Stutzerimonas stutzeri TaxID=316 RepID=A0A2N8S1T7_STUST|nr:DUF2726 domain-containing protein [Stutzerimonas stutzeri]MCQ4295752.1 DUF2726 domain-containing protein [Stutzerimonas stutzeri]PNF80591.1 hypothetical protein CXK92_10230 [Stutzerimonas stutzeri]
MSWLALTLVAFVCFVLVFFVKNRQLNHPALQYPYSLKAPLFSPAERELLEMLQRTAGEQYVILPKVSVAEVVEITAVPRRAYWYQAHNRIAAARFDFVLCAREDLTPVCVINLDDPDTEQEFMDRLCETIGLPHVRLAPETARSYADVREAIESALRA